LKLLFAANRFPYPPYRGDKLKIYNLAKKLSVHHELHLITFIQNENDRQYLSKLEPYFKKIVLIPHTKIKSIIQACKSFFSNRPLQVGYFYNPQMSIAIDQLLAEEQYDAVHIQHLRLAQYWTERTHIPRILDLPDAYSLYWKRRIKSSTGLMKAFNALEYKRVFKYEKILNTFDLTLVCSEEDQKYLIKDNQISNVELLPNGVDCQRFSFPENTYNENKTILFTGNMDYAPNVDAVSYFVEDIFPLILKKVPSAQFIIAGQRPVDKVLSLASHNVKVTGFIENLSDVYKKASIVVAPLRFGAGTQNKVLEAMATGIPVVSRNIGFKGLGIKNGDGVLLEVTTQGFADACIQLLKNRDYRMTVGQKGNQVVREKYDWSSISQLLEKYFLHIKK